MIQNKPQRPQRNILFYQKPSPLRGEGKGGGGRSPETPFLPLTLTLSPKGRGEITLDNKGGVER
jgi:hypothetical protein